MKLVRRREIDIIIVQKLDRLDRSLVDLVSLFRELQNIDAGFVPLSESIDFRTRTGRAMMWLLGVFAELSENF